MSWRPSSTPSTTLPVTHLPRKLLAAFTYTIRPSPTPYGLHSLHTAFTHSIRPSLSPYGLHPLHTAFTHSIRPLSTPYGLCPLHTAFRSSPQPLLWASMFQQQPCSVPPPLWPQSLFWAIKERLRTCDEGLKVSVADSEKKYIFNMKSIAWNIIYGE